MTISLNARRGGDSEVVRVTVDVGLYMPDPQAE